MRQRPKAEVKGRESLNDELLCDVIHLNLVLVDTCSGGSRHQALQERKNNCDMWLVL